MEDISKIVEEKNKSMSFEEYKNKSTKNNFKETKFSKFLSTIIFWPFHVIKAIFGVDKEDLTYTRSSGHNTYIGGNTINTSSSQSTFREQHHFNPEQAYIERMQEKAYFQMVDGKGDPERCDCDHDR